MTVENKKIVSYFGIAIGLGLVGAMIYYGLKKDNTISIDNTDVKLGEEEQNTDSETKTNTNIFSSLPKFNESIEFQFKPLGLSVLK